MANITLMGASYTDVPAVTLPQTGGGTVTFYENGGGGGDTQTIYCGTSTPSASLGANGDIYMQMASGATIERYPEAYTSANMNSTSGLSACVGVSAEDGTSTSNVYSSGSSVTGTADYTFDLSDIPANATITDISCAVKAHEENASRSTCTLQLYAGSTAKGSVTTVDGTSNKTYNLSCGTWTRAELDTLKLRLSVGYYGGLIAGATLSITYEAAAQWSASLSGDADGIAMTSAGMYQKSGGSWSKVSSVDLADLVARG